jgi:DNA mismatch endonuclease (patch repair protein)
MHQYRADETGFSNQFRVLNYVRLTGKQKNPRYSGDTLSQDERSERMSRVRSKNTKPELIVRKLLTSMGYRYRLHQRSVPGNPDIVFSQRKKVIFVHGCYWHRHRNCPNCRLPKSNLKFWKPKLEGNKIRDLKNQRELTRAGWRFMVVWECEVKDSHLGSRLKFFLEDAR